MLRGIEDNVRNEEVGIIDSDDHYGDEDIDNDLKVRNRNNSTEIYQLNTL